MCVDGDACPGVTERVHIGDRSVDKDAHRPAGPCGGGRHRADHRVGVIGAGVDDQHVGGAQLDDGAVDRGGVRFVEYEGGGGSDHPSCLAGPPDCRVEESVLQEVSKCREVDTGRLLERVRVHLAGSGSIVDAATALYCHRNTVQHRFRRFHELTGRDVRRPEDAALIAIALRVRGQSPQGQQS